MKSQNPILTLGLLSAVTVTARPVPDTGAPSGVLDPLLSSRNPQTLADTTAASTSVSINTSTKSETDADNTLPALTLRVDEAGDKDEESPSKRDEGSGHAQSVDCKHNCGPPSGSCVIM